MPQYSMGNRGKTSAPVSRACSETHYFPRLSPAQPLPVTKLPCSACCCCPLMYMALLLFNVHATVIGQSAAAGVGISGSWPSSLHKFVPTTVRVTLNTSACSQLGEGAGDDARLVLQHVTAQGGSLTFRHSAAGVDGAISSRTSSVSNSGGGSSYDCTTFDFPVLLNGDSMHGNITARLLLPKVGLSLQLQDPIMVSEPLLLSVTTPLVNITADQAPFAVGVRLSRPAPAGGVTVQLQLGDAGAAKVEPEVLFWPEGAEGIRNFTLVLLAIQQNGILTARLVLPSGGAVLHPSATAVKAVVQSPVVAFNTNLGYYRGINSSTTPRLTFTVTGSSAFPVEFAFTTFVLPGSRPSLLPCHPLAPACSVADQEAVDNITISGSRYITPGQQGVTPVDLPIAWGRLPPEAELRVGVRIISLRNCRAADQAGDVAAIIFGTPPGHCPPGAVRAEEPGGFVSNSSRGSQQGNHVSDRPTYTHVAALQELALVLDAAGADHTGRHTFDPADNVNRRRILSASANSSRSIANSNSSTTTSSNWRSKKAGSSTQAKSGNGSSFSTTQGGSGKNSISKGTVLLPSNAAAAKAVIRPTASSSSGSSSGTNSSSSSTLDLDPPFRPLVERYIALLPPGPETGQLMMSSSRWGDVVVVDTTACGELDSARYTVVWDKNQQLWREYYPLAGQEAPCWIRVHVFTRLTDSTTAGSDGSSTSEQGTSSDFRPGLKDPAPAATATEGSVGSRRRPLQLFADMGVSAASSNRSNGSSGTGSGSGALANDMGNNSSSSGSSSSSSSSGGGSSSPSVWDLPSDFVLYRSYTIRFVPLRPPAQLSLRSITFSNNSTTVIACGVPQAWAHLFLQPGQQQPAAARATARPSSIMSSNYAAASSRAADSQRTNSSRGNTTSTPAAAALVPAPVATSAVAAGNSSFQPLPAGDDVGAGQAATAGSSAGSSTGPPPALTAAPGVDVQVAYLVMKAPGSNSSSSSAAQEVAAAAKLPNRLRLQQFSVLDRVSNRTVIWSRFTSAECAQDRYILLPMAQLKPDMKMVPELVDPKGFDAGVRIAMSAAAVALPGAAEANSSTGSSSSSGSGSGSGSSGVSSSSSSHLGVPSDGSSSASSWLLEQKFQGSVFSGNAAAAAAASAAVDGGKGYGGAGSRNLGDEVWCGSSNSTAAGVMRDTGGSGGLGSGSGCRLRLPGLTAELPIILTADEGRSSKTYTMLLYSNATAAAAVHDLILPQEAAAGGSGHGSSGSSSQAADAAALSAAFFADRPKEWPQSPAQNSQCSVCPNGTYSTRTDAPECKVCPPGKYAASPFSTTCLYCPPGSFSYYWGAPTCRTCLPGTFAAGAGSLFCDICREGTTTRTEGATQCEVVVAGGSSRLDETLGSADVAILLSFGLLLDGTSLESVSRSLTGINGSSEGIVGVLVRGDTASALNISLGSVQVLAVQQIGSRQLLVNVSAALPVSTDQAAAAAATQQDLSADPLIQRLIDDPNTFLRTTQTLGAESASVQDITTQMTQRAKWRHQLQLHAILWPTLVGFLLLVGFASWGWRRRHRRQMQLAQMASGRTEPAAAVSVGGLVGLFGGTLQQRSARGGGVGAAGQIPAHSAGRWGRTAAAPVAGADGPGWFYGDGFMFTSGAAAPAGADLGRVSINSSDAGDGMGRRAGRGGVGGAWRHLQRLLSSNIRIVFKVQGSNSGSGGGSGSGQAGGAVAGNSGFSSPVSTSPGRSSCGTSEADWMERGLDEYRVKVLVGGGVDGAGSSSSPHGCCSQPHQHDLCLQEESFAARLRSKQPQMQ